MGKLYEDVVQPLLRNDEIGDFFDAERLWIVPSDSDDEKWYLVTKVRIDDIWAYLCQCEGWRYSSDDRCRHIRRVTNV